MRSSCLWVEFFLGRFIWILVGVIFLAVLFYRAFSCWDILDTRHEYLIPFTFQYTCVRLLNRFLLSNSDCTEGCGFLYGQRSELLPQTNWIQPGSSLEAIQQNWFPWSRMPACHWMGETVNCLNASGGQNKSLRSSPTFLTSLWTIKCGAPAVRLLLCLLLLPLCLFCGLLSLPLSRRAVWQGHTIL